MSQPPDPYKPPSPDAVPPPPGYGQPSYGQPSYGQPSYGQPSYDAPPSYGSSATGPDSGYPPAPYGQPQNVPDPYGAPAPGYGAPAGMPAQQPDYSAQQPGYQQPGYPAQQQYGGTPPVSVGESFNWSWAKFQQNFGPFLLAMVIWAVGIGILAGIWSLVVNLIAMGLTGSTDSHGRVSSMGTGLFTAGFFISTLLGGLVYMTALFLAEAGLMRGALQVTYGQKVELKTFFSFDQIGAVIGTALLLGVGSVIVGMLTFGIGAVVVVFFGIFAIQFVLDKRLSPIEAIKASMQLVKQNIGPSALLLLMVWVVEMVGGLACGIGLLVAFPVALLMISYTYRRLLGEPVAP